MTTTKDTQPIEFTRTVKGPFGYEYVATTPVGVFMVRKEATTHAYPRGAANPRWFIYQGNGEVGQRLAGSWRTLDEAQIQVRRHLGVSA